MCRMWRLVFQSIVSANTTTACLNQGKGRGRAWRDLVKIQDQRCPHFSKTHVIVTAGHRKPLVPISVICREMVSCCPLPLLSDVHLLIQKLGWNNKVKWGRGGLGFRPSTYSGESLIKPTFVSIPTRSVNCAIQCHAIKGLHCPGLVKVLLTLSMMRLPHAVTKGPARGHKSQSLAEKQTTFLAIV